MHLCIRCSCDNRERHQPPCGAPLAIIARLLMLSPTHKWHCTCRLHTMIAPACVKLCTRLQASMKWLAERATAGIAYVVTTLRLSAPWYSCSTASSSAVAVGRTAAARDRHGSRTGRRRDCRHVGGCSASASSHGNCALPSACCHTSSVVRRTTRPTMASNATTPASKVCSQMQACYTNLAFCSPVHLSVSSPLVDHNTHQSGRSGSRDVNASQLAVRM